MKNNTLKKEQLTNTKNLKGEGTMKLTKKNIERLCEERNYSFYDYFIDDMYTENKYYIKNWQTGKLKGFDRLSDIYEYFND